MDDLDKAIRITEDNKMILELDTDCVVLVANAKTGQFRVLGAQKNNTLLKIFDMFVWLMSESPMAIALMPNIILGWRLDTNDDHLNVKGTKSERKYCNSGLADALFKNVINKKRKTE